MQTMVHFGKEVEIYLIVLQLRKFCRQYKVEEWAQKCGFRISVEKTQVICFTKKRNVCIKLSLYGKQLEQVSVVKFLGVWLDEKLKIDVEKLTKCKKALNVMRCLADSEWGAGCGSLRNIYLAVISK